MRIPIDRIAGAVKMGAEAKRDADVPVRVAVFVDGSASAFLIESVRDAFVPQTTSALVRVERLGDAPASPKPDTDVVLVLTCGSGHLRERVQELVVAGAPVVVVAESSVEAPFIREDTPLLGLVAATDREHLLQSLARWILARTEKGTAFAANFPFMREQAARRIATSAALANAATGALVFMPGADFPVMTLAQAGMALQLAGVYGKPLRPERGYELAAVLASALALRACSRALSRHAGRASFAVKALVGGAGTYGMGWALSAFYARDVDYSALNGALAAAARRAAALVGQGKDAAAGGGRDAAPAARG